MQETKGGQEEEAEKGNTGKSDQSHYLWEHYLPISVPSIFSFQITFTPLPRSLVLQMQNQASERCLL